MGPGPDAKRRGRARWVRAGLFLVVVYAIAGPRLLDRWREHGRQGDTRSEGSRLATSAPAIADDLQAPQPVVRAEIAADEIIWHPVRGAQTVLDAGTEIELTADQVERLNDLAAAAKMPTDELWLQRVDIESRIEESQGAEIVNATGLSSWAEQVARADEERIAVQEQSYEDAIEVLHPPQKARMAEILDGGQGRSSQQ